MHPHLAETWMARALKLWPVVASALLYVLAFPTPDLWPLVLLCLLPWLFFLERVRPKVAFWSSYLLGFIVVLEQMSFVQSLVIRWTNDLLLSLVPWIVAAFLGAFYFAFVGWLINRCLSRRWLWAIPIAWAGVEVMRSFIPGLAFPWFILGSPLWHAPAVIQPAFYGTVYLVSAFAVTCNLLIFLALKRLPKLEPRGYGRANLTGLICFLAIYIVASFTMYARPIDGTVRNFLIGQTGVDMAFGDPAGRERGIRVSVDYLFDKARAARSDLLVLPEGLVEGGDSLPPNTSFIVPDDVPVLFGGRRGGNPAFQTAYGYDGSWSYADKTRLVVFGEYVPGRDFLPFLTYFKLPSGDLKAALQVRSVDVRGMRVGPLLCFEGLFYDVAHKQSENGAQLLAIMSIDDWYMGTPAPEQLMSASVWRAVETGLPVVRAASLGYSLAVDQRGRMVAKAPLARTAGLPVSLAIETSPKKNPTRPLLPWLSSLFTIVLAIQLKLPFGKRAHLSEV